ncbi:MAG: Rab family GTPase [Thermoplasmata archaeon]
MYGREIKKKINLMGDPSVGKTSLVLRYVKNVFGEGYLKTIGTNIYKKEVPVIGAEIKMLIQDIMGERGYESVQEAAFRNSNGAIAVADATRMETLDSLIDEWLPKYKGFAGRNASIVLAVNKDDLDNKEITEEFVVAEVASHFDYMFFTSAKTGKGVEDAFTEIASRVLFHTQLAGEDIENSLLSKDIDNPSDLVGALFAYSSDRGEMPYSTMEHLLKKSDIDKYKLDEPIKEKNALLFAKKVMDWLDKSGKKESSEFVHKLIQNYKGSSDIGYY